MLHHPRRPVPSRSTSSGGSSARSAGRDPARAAAGSSRRSRRQDAPHERRGRRAARRRAFDGAGRRADRASTPTASLVLANEQARAAVRPRLRRRRPPAPGPRALLPAGRAAQRASSGRPASASAVARDGRRVAPRRATGAALARRPASPRCSGDGALLGVAHRLPSTSPRTRGCSDASSTPSKRELESAYEELQSTVEELETTNEELQSTNEELETTNEELQSTNEELETMNEELQSTNEELETMNDELRDRALELDEVNAFLETILTRPGVAVVVLDAQPRRPGLERASPRTCGVSARRRSRAATCWAWTSACPSTGWATRCGPSSGATSAASRSASRPSTGSAARSGSRPSACRSSSRTAR